MPDTLTPFVPTRKIDAALIESLRASKETLTGRARSLANLIPHKKGMPAPAGSGRPKGHRNAATIYLESLPHKARQWVKSEHPSILIDARKIALPLESDDAATGTVQLIFNGEQLRPTLPVDSATVNPPIEQQPSSQLTLSVPHLPDADA